jgi:hypothetical protein
VPGEIAQGQLGQSLVALETSAVRGPLVQQCVGVTPVDDRAAADECRQFGVGQRQPQRLATAREPGVFETLADLFPAQMDVPRQRLRDDLGGRVENIVADAE